MATEIGRLKATVGTLITWIAQSSVGVLSKDEAMALLSGMDAKMTPADIVAEWKRQQGLR